jgi:acetyltransferase-like isoleucine patch superfamily enzyme
METITINNDKQSLNNVKVGKDVKIFNFVNAYGCSIDDGSKVGAFVEIQKGATIGKNCKISSHSFICEGVHIEDNVFIGHNVTFINDRFPRATNEDGSIQTDADWHVEETRVKNGASLGSSVTVLCGITIGENSIVGAGSVVLKDVPDNVIVAGNPARVLRAIGKK